MAPPWTTIVLALLALTSQPALAQEPTSSLPAAETPADANTRIRVAILRSDGFAPQAELERAIRLRLPGVTLVSDGEAAPVAEQGSLRAVIDLRRDNAELLLTLILAEGRAYLRPLELDADGQKIAGALLSSQSTFGRLKVRQTRF